jgi:hypothetical protein
MERLKYQNKDIQLLLDALENSDNLIQENESLEGDGDVVEFINTFNIGPGDKKLFLKTLYVYYKNWSHFPISKPQFTKVIRRLFEIKSPTNAEYILIKNDFLELNNEIIRAKKAKKHLRKTFLIKKNIESFIDQMGIKESETWTDVKTIYKWYIKWRYKKKIVKLSVNQFKKLLKFYFQSKIGNNNAFFKLKGEFNMERIDQLRGTQNGKTKQTVKGEIPSIKTGAKSKDKT